MSDKEQIEQTIQHYIDGAREGKGDIMKPAFHADATIFGYIGPDLFGAATDIQTKIAAIDIEGTIATARLEADNWTGHKFTDMFTLLKTDGEWQIINKVFHLHG